METLGRRVYLLYSLRGHCKKNLGCSLSVVKRRSSNANQQKDKGNIPTHVIQRAQDNVNFKQIRFRTEIGNTGTGFLCLLLDLPSWCFEFILQPCIPLGKVRLTREFP